MSFASRSLRTFGSLFTFALLLLFPSLLPAAAEPTFGESLRIGFSDQYKLGLWTTIEVQLIGGQETARGKLKVQTYDGSGHLTFAEAPQALQLLPGQTLSAEVYTKIGLRDLPIVATFDYETASGVAGQAQIRFDLGSKPPLPTAVAMHAPLILVMGPSIGLEAVIKAERWPADAAPVVIQVSDVRTLPTRWFGYDGIAWVACTSSDPAFYNAMSDAQRAALLSWVNQGGKVLVSLDESAEGFLAAVGEVPKAFIPGQFDGLYELTSARAIEEFAGVEARLFPNSETRLRIPLLAVDQGAVLAADRDAAPLLIHSAYGFGEVVTSTLPLSSRLFTDWEGQRAFYQRIIGWQPATEGDDPTTGVSQAFMQDQITDLSTDLRAGLERFPSVRYIEPWLVGVLIFIYILIIGPGDYFFVKKVLGRMEYTWITFPSAVILVSVGSYWLAWWSKGDTILVNQVTIVDVDLAGDQVRSSTWANVFSPRAAAYRLTARPALPFAKPPADVVDATALVSWFGMPEEHAIGGMGNQGSVPETGGKPYTLRTQPAQIDGLPILYHSTRAITGRLIQQGGVPISVRVTQQAAGNLEGILDTVEVTNHLAEPLTDCLFIHGRDSYQLGDLEAGATKSYKLGALERQTLADRLTRMRQELDTTQNIYRYRREPYVRGSGDVNQITRIMMFYQAVDGRNYTGLFDSYQAFVDMTGHLDAGQTMLFARSKQAGVTWYDGDAPLGQPEQQHGTYYRVLAPLGKE